MTTAAIAMVAAAIAAPRLVPDGILGQSEQRADPVEWTACRHCVADADGNVHLPGGWRVPASGGAPERMPRRVKGVLMTDGRDIYSWRAEHCALKRLAVGRDGLSETPFAFKPDNWKHRLFLSPAGCTRGFAAKAKLVALDVEKREVRGWDADGKSVGRLFAYGGAVERPELVRSVAVHPETGDLLLGSYWPECKVHRFDVEGRERVDQVWPFRAMAEDFALADGRVFAVGERAYELSDKFGARSFGVNSGATYGVARGKGGWWLATSQGAQFYSDAAVRSGAAASRRIGALDGVTALGISRGRVVLAMGYSIHSLWLDDLRHEPLSSDRGWCSLGKWAGAVRSIETPPDGTFVLRWSDGKSSAAWQFDPRITEWVHRKRRLHSVDGGLPDPRPANEAVVGGLRAVAEKGEIVLYDGSRRVCSYKVAATALAAEGRWLVAYVPALKGLVRFRLEGGVRR